MGKLDICYMHHIYDRSPKLSIYQDELTFDSKDMKIKNKMRTTRDTLSIVTECGMQFLITYDNGKYSLLVIDNGDEKEYEYTSVSCY